MNENEKNDYLFTRYHNQMAVSLYKLIQEAANGKTYTENDLRKKLPDFDDSLDDLTESLLALFLKKDETQETIELRYPSTFTLPDLPPGKPELRWLKTFLEDDALSFLLSPDLRQKLIAKLKDNYGDITSFTTNQPRILIHDPITQNPLRHVLLQLKEALQKDAAIKLQTDGESHKAFPFRLEFNAQTGHFSLWISPDGHDFQRLPLISIMKMELLSEKKPDLLPAFEKFLKSHQQKIQLQISSSRNTVPRFFSLFSSYDKENAVYDEKADTYTVDIIYYDFDEIEVINNIISLGKNVFVLGPEEIRNKVIHRLRKIVALYSQE